MPGPVGKRSDQKHGHRTKSELAVDKAPAGQEVVWHPEAPEWDPIAKRFYASLQVSGQAEFYEQSDAELAYYVAEAMSRNLAQGRFSGQLFSSVISSMGDLLVSEGARRRAKLELQRGQAEGSSEVDDAIRDLMSQFPGAGPSPSPATSGGDPQES